MESFSHTASVLIPCILIFHDGESNRCIHSQPEPLCHTFFSMKDNVLLKPQVKISPFFINLLCQEFLSHGKEK